MGKQYIQMENFENNTEIYPNVMRENLVSEGVLLDLTPNEIGLTGAIDEMYDKFNYLGQNTRDLVVSNVLLESKTHSFKLQDENSPVSFDNCYIEQYPEFQPYQLFLSKFSYVHTTVTSNVNGKDEPFSFINGDTLKAKDIYLNWGSDELLKIMDGVIQFQLLEGNVQLNEESKDIGLFLTYVLSADSSSHKKKIASIGELLDGKLHSFSIEDLFQEKISSCLVQLLNPDTLVMTDVKGVFKNAKIMFRVIDKKVVDKEYPLTHSRDSFERIVEINGVNFNSRVTPIGYEAVPTIFGMGKRYLSAARWSEPEEVVTNLGDGEKTYVFYPIKPFQENVNLDMNKVGDYWAAFGTVGSLNDFKAKKIDLVRADEVPKEICGPRYGLLGTLQAENFIEHKKKYDSLSNKEIGLLAKDGEIFKIEPQPQEVDILDPNMVSERTFYIPLEKKCDYAIFVKNDHGEDSDYTLLEDYHILVKIVPHDSPFINTLLAKKAYTAIETENLPESTQEKIVRPETFVFDSSNLQLGSRKKNNVWINKTEPIKYVSGGVIEGIPSHLALNFYAEMEEGDQAIQLLTNTNAPSSNNFSRFLETPILVSTQEGGIFGKVGLKTVRGMIRSYLISIEFFQENGETGSLEPFTFTKDTGIYFNIPIMLFKIR